MVAVTYTVAFHGVEARPVEVQCAVAPGLPSFQIVGLANKAVSEAREKVRAALDALSIALPYKRITVNLSPADMPKEGSHFDLPIAVALLSALGMILRKRLALAFSWVSWLWGAIWCRLPVACPQRSPPPVTGAA